MPSIASGSVAAADQTRVGAKRSLTSNKTSRTDVQASRVHDYEYDSQYRMVHSTRSGSPAAHIYYDLDGVGNSTEVTGGSLPGTYVMSATAPVPNDAPVNQYTEIPGDEREYDCAV